MSKKTKVQFGQKKYIIFTIYLFKKNIRCFFRESRANRPRLKKSSNLCWWLRILNLRVFVVKSGGIIPEGYDIGCNSIIGVEAYCTHS